jgi:hypothetical protein
MFTDGAGAVVFRSTPQEPGARAPGEGCPSAMDGVKVVEVFAPLMTRNFQML